MANVPHSQHQQPGGHGPTDLRLTAPVEGFTTPWLRPVEVARYLRLGGVKSVFALIAAGKLRARQIGGKRTTVIHVDWVRAYLESED